MNTRRSKAISPPAARRSFLKQAALVGIVPSLAAPSLWAGDNGTGATSSRAHDAFQLRQQLAQEDFQANLPSHPDNGDEQAYPTRIGSFSKGLPHNNLGEVDVAAYQT